MLAGDVVARTAVLATALVAARAVQPSAFGLYAALSAIALAAAAAWDLGTSVVVSREVGARRLSARAAFRQGLHLRILALPVWLIALTLGLILVKGFPAFSAELCVPFTVASAAMGFSSLSIAAQRGAQRFSAAAVAQAAGRWVTTGLSVCAFFAELTETRLLILGIAFAVGESVVFALSAAQVRIDRMQGEDGREAELSIRESLPFAANAMMGMIYNRFDVVLVGVLASAAAAGGYVVASRSQDALYTIPSALAAVALPVISGAIADGGTKAAQLLIRRFWMMGLPVATLLTAVLILIAPVLVPSVLGSNYSSSVVPVQILALFLPLAVIQAPILAGLIGIGQGKLTTLVFLAAFGTSTILLVFLAPRFGATGAAVASLGRDLVATPLCLFLGYRHGLVAGSLRTPHRAAGDLR